MTQPEHPLLLDLDDGTWSDRLDKVERWLATTRLLQAAYRRLVTRTSGRVSEPHIRSYLTELRDTARAHESTVDDLYRAFGRRPAPARLPRTLGAGVLGPAREAVGHLEGAAAGATTGSWRTLRMVMLSNLDAISGFAVTEQLGLALGVPAVVDITFPVLRRKTQDQLLLQEYLLEMASNALLLDKKI